jgi:hypothetical protein
MACGAVALLLLVVEIYGASGDRRYRATGHSLPGTEALNPDMPVEIAVVRD